MPETRDLEEATLPPQLQSTAEQTGQLSRLQFRVRHLLFFLFFVALISGLIQNINEAVVTGFTVLLALGGPIFVLLIVIGIAIRPAFSFPWKLSSQEKD